MTHRYWLLLLAALVLLGLRPSTGQSQITPEQADQLRNVLGNRIEALTILGGDFGLSDGHYRSTEPNALGGPSSRTELSVSKFGGVGDVGDPQPLGDSGIGWQPRLQGNVGYLESTNYLHGPLLGGDVSRYRDFAIQFGGGVRLWVNDALSFAPSIVGMYGRTSNEYTANSAFGRANLAYEVQAGLLGWRIDTWSVRSAMDIQYLIRWNRVIITLASDPTFFRTESFHDSGPGVRVSGDSASLANKLDVDVPLGIEVYGHEVRTGGYFSRTELYGDLKSGLDVQHVDELHARVVLDFLHQVWKVQWLGVGTSYLWGPNIHGWTVGVDLAWRF